MKMYLLIPDWFEFDFNVSEAKPKDKMIEVLNKDGREIVAEFNLNKEQIKKVREICKKFLELTKVEEELVAGFIYKEKSK